MQPDMSERPNPEKLTCVSLLVCDDVYRDEKSKKLVVVGVFNAVITPSLPTVQPRLTVLFTLTNGQGEYELSLAIEHEQSGATIVELKGPLKLENPLHLHDFNVVMSDVKFPRPGKYWIVLKADNAIICQRPIMVVEQRQPESNTEGGKK